MQRRQDHLIQLTPVRTDHPIPCHGADAFSETGWQSEGRTFARTRLQASTSTVKMRGPTSN